MSDNENGHFIGHTHCIASEMIEAGIPRWGKEEYIPCNSGDGLAQYESDTEDAGVTYSGFCWSCNQNFFPEHLAKSSLAEELGMDTSGVVGERKEFVRKGKQPALDKGQVKSLISKLGYTDETYRGIRPETLKFFGHLAETGYDGNVKAFYYPETNDESKGWPTGYKIRYLPKYFSKVGQTGIKSHLAGQTKFMKGNHRDILLVGGEVDLCSAYQMLRDNQVSRNQSDYVGVPVVSPTTGEGSAVKQIASQYDFFDNFDNIYIGFDSDEAGIAATKAVATVLPKEKVRIISWSMNDPNKMLTSGKEKQFMRDFWNAKDLVPSELKASANALEEAREFLDSPKIELPPFLHRLQTAMRGGIKTTGAIINLIGDTSIGKSLFTDALLYHWFWNSPLVPTIVSLERTTGELTVDFLSMHLKNNLSWFEDSKDALAVIDSEDNQELIQDLLTDGEGQSRYHVLDERSGSPDGLKACVEKANIKFGSRLIIFDPLTDFLRSLGTEAQEDFMMWQKQKKKEGIVFINVLHTRKPTPDKEGNIRKVTEYDALGSGTFVQSADANIVINRDKMSECPIDRNTTCIDVPKIRGGTTGHACDIYYDYKERQLYDLIDHMIENPELEDTRVIKEDEDTSSGFSKKKKSNKAKPQPQELIKVGGVDL